MTAIDRPWGAPPPDASTVPEFVSGPGVQRLDIKVDIDRIRESLDDVLERLDYDTTYGEWGFGVLPVTRRPGTEGRDPVDLSGRFWIRGDDRYLEEPRDPIVDEHRYSELVPEFVDTYIAQVVEALRSIARIGRVRINLKDPFNANSWHRDPEPRIHVPIHTNPGCLFIVNHHSTHLPADGSVYFTDTRGYHTALNGGDTPRVHLVAAVLGDA
ncbi:MAG: aspartyl/asparaginyl beta-hydroxylase domain-containing protein [Actinomycetota bacterium]